MAQKRKSTAKPANWQKDWQAWVSIKWKSGTPINAWKTWEKNKWIQNAWSTTGDWDCALWVKCSTPDDLENFVWKTIRSNKWVDDTETHWVKQWC